MEQKYRPHRSGPPALPGPSSGWPGYGQPPIQQSQPSGGGFHPSSILRIIRKNIWLFVIFISLGILAGFVSVVLTTPIYNARVLLEVQNAGSPDGNRNSFDFDASQTGLQTQLTLLQSGPFLRRAAERTQMESLPPLPGQNDVFSILRRKLRKSSGDPAEFARNGLGAAAGSFSAQVVNGTRLLELRCDAPHPEIAANFVNMMATEFIEETNRARTLAVRRNSEWLLAQVEETKANMRAAEEKLQTFVRASGNMFAAQETTVDDAKLRQLQSELARIQADRIAKQTRYDMVKKATPEQLPDVLKEGQVQSYAGQINALKTQRAAMLTTLTPNHEKVIKLQVQIDNLENLLAQEIEAGVTRAKHDYETSARQESLLRSAYASQAGQVTAQSDRAGQYNALRREMELLRQMYASLLTQSNQVSLMSSTPASPIRLVEPSTPAGAPSKPKPLTNLLLGTMSGAVLAAGIAFLRDLLEARISSPEAVRSLIGLPQLGVIPSTNFATPANGTGKMRGWFKKSEMTSLVPHMQAENGDLPAHSTWSNQRSPVVESFRTVLASILRGSADIPEMIVLTSPGPGEGKTTIAAHLGLALMETGRKVLLIDADFRRPRLHREFGVSNGKGFTTILADDRPIPGYSFEDLYTATNLPGLFILPSGQRSPVLPRALYSVRLRELLERTRKDFDVVLIDVPPVLQFADARLIARLTDGLVLVLRSGITNREEALEACRRLDEDGVQLLGTVLNDWIPSGSMARSYSYYSYESDET